MSEIVLESFKRTILCNFTKADFKDIFEDLFVKSDVYCSTLEIIDKTVLESLYMCSVMCTLGTLLVSLLQFSMYLHHLFPSRPRCLSACRVHGENSFTTSLCPPAASVRREAGLVV